MLTHFQQLQQGNYGTNGLRKYKVKKGFLLPAQKVYDGRSHKEKGISCPEIGTEVGTATKDR